MDKEDSLHTSLLDSEKDAASFLENESYNCKRGNLRSLLTATAFTINFIFGAGILGIPIAFVSGGILAGILTLAFVSIFSVASMIWEVETAARAEAILCYEEEAKEASSHLTVSSDVPVLPDFPDYKVTPGKFNISQLCRFFLGPKWEKFYDLCLWLNTISTMWLYTVIFVASAAGAIPLPHLSTSKGEYTTHCDISGITSALELSSGCMASYYIFWVVFALLGLFLSSQKIAEQRKLHLLLTTFGLTCILTMVLTAAAALASEPFGIHHFPHSHIAEIPMMFDAQGFSRAFNTFIFAQMAHQGVPQLIEVMDDPRQANSAFKLALSTTTFCYLALGLTCAFFFGEGVKDVITLNWKDYTAERKSISLFSLIISYLVRIFPVISVTAAFPLNAICLGSTLHANLKAKSPNQSDSIRFGCLTISKRVILTWMVCMIPLLGGAFLSSISFLTSAIGLCGFVIAFIVPGCLQLASIKAVNKRLYGGSVHKDECMYNCFKKQRNKKIDDLCNFPTISSKRFNRTCSLSSDPYIFLVLLFSVVSIGYTVLVGLRQLM